MKKLVLLFTLAAFVACAPLAMAKDVNWCALMQTWNEQQAAIAKKKADEEKAQAAAKSQGKVVSEAKKKENK